MGMEVLLALSMGQNTFCFTALAFILYVMLTGGPGGEA